MRLIDVDALIEEHCNGCSKDIQEGCKTDPVCATLMWFEEAPTIDAVPVVRCLDCKHNVANWRHDELDATDYDDITCDFFMTDGMCANDFCSFGER